MKKISITTKVDDDFEPGCCYECPFSYQEYYDYDGYMEYEDYCVLHHHYDECPVEIIKE